jgi:prevent-host-death family protein
MSRKIREIAADEFNAHCLALIDEVIETGEEILVTKNGRAVARVAPIAGVPSLHGSVLYQGDLVSPVDGWPDDDELDDDKRASTFGTAQGAVRALFGALASSIQIFGDIVAPIDVEWGARK